MAFFDMQSQGHWFFRISLNGWLRHNHKSGVQVKIIWFLLLDQTNVGLITRLEEWQVKIFGFLGINLDLDQL